MKKSVVTLTIASALIVAAIWGCKKTDSQKTTQPASSGSSAMVMSAKMSKQEADNAGALHNGGLGAIRNYLQDVAQRGLYEVPSSDINLQLQSYMESQGQLNPAASYDFDGVANSILPVDLEADPLSFTAKWLADGRINPSEKYYLDLAVVAFVNVAVTVDPEAEQEPPIDPSQTVYNKIDQIQDLVIADENLTEESNNKLLMALSVMKYSARYWYSTDELMLPDLKGVGGKVAVSSACKKCLKKYWPIIAFYDVGGFLSGLVATLGWGSVPVAILCSLIASGGYCNMCWN